MTDEFEVDDFTIQLNSPVNWGKREVHELTFREPTGPDMDRIKMDIGSMTQGEIMMIAAKLCGESPRLLSMLKKKDRLEVLEKTCFLLGEEEE